MANEIKFDYAKAQTLLNAVNECGKNLEELVFSLSGEIGGAGQWWKGESYDTFKARFDGAGKGKSTFEGLSKKVSEVSIRLNKISDAKKDFEKNTAKAF